MRRSSLTGVGACGRLPIGGGDLAGLGQRLEVVERPLLEQPGREAQELRGRVAEGPARGVEADAEGDLRPAALRRRAEVDLALVRQTRPLDRLPALTPSRPVLDDSRVPLEVPAQRPPDLPVEPAVAR